GTCKPATCTDGVKNGDETGVDCGGACTVPETCNGVDDDCNGSVDDGLGTISCGVGACQVNAPSCVNGQPGACIPGAPTAEVCDNLDNDCDGQTDEGNPGGGQACNTGLSGVCSAGATMCAAGGQIVCAQTTQSTAEVCDTVDNDCDGIVDEGCGCADGQTQPCYGGPAGTQGVGLCHAGVQTCAAGVFGACVGAVTPAPEACNGADDNCNGQTDEGLGTISCGVGACNTTVPACAGGQPNNCTPGVPTAEVCDGVDNDCNGLTDDNVPSQACNTGLQGVCSAGTTACVGAALICMQTTPAAGVEDCSNALDDTCDGVVNEGCVCVPSTTAACYSGPANTNGVGLCHGGTKTCNAAGTAYGACVGEVTPAASESCGTVGDDNCNGSANEGCAATTCNLFTETFDPAVHPQNTAFYKADWCNETTVPSSNMPLCMAGTRGMRTNGSSSSAQLWVYRGTSSCTGVKISYQWYQFAASTSSLQYLQNSDSSFATCPSGSFTTAVTSAAQSALQVCSSTNNIVIPFSANANNNSVYIKFTNANFSNNAMWYDNVVVQLVGCPCN
ncbi:MAG: MopE-related protein, partial [Minicystis sp.]